MSRSGWTPSIVPNGVDQNSYLVEDCLGRNGCVWREADSEQTNLETVITDLMSGQYGDSQRVIAFNTAEVTDTFRVTTAFTDINTTFDPGGRIGQIVWRVNW